MTLKSLSQYGKSFQFKVLGALLTDRKFLLNVRELIDDTYFDSDAHKWIITAILEYFDEYNTTITLDVLKLELKKIENDVLKAAVRQELKNSYESSKDDLEYVQEEFTSFCKNQKLKSALLESADLLKEGNYEVIRSRIENALKAGLDKDIGHNYNKDIETRYRKDYRPTIPTPWPLINDKLQGGWGPGDLGIIFGNPGGGKSWVMVSVAAHAAKMGYNVNFYSLELGEDYVGKRFDCNITGKGIDEIGNHRDLVENAMNTLKGRLIIREYPPKSATINTIKAHVQRTTELHGKPDLIIVDYLDYLRPPARKYSERKGEIDDVFIAAKGLAKELQIPILSPSQVNRMGAKDDIIEGDKAAGSYDKMMVADICFSLSRKKEDKVLGTGRLHIMKNRYGMDGQTFEVDMDTNTGRIHIQSEVDIDLERASEKESFSQVKRKFFQLQT